MKIIPPSSSYSTVSLHEYPLPERNARPVYAIAHKCNDQYDVVKQSIVDSMQLSVI